MHSLTEEILAARAGGILGEAEATDALARERGLPFCVSGELRAALYVAVAMVATGIGILIKDHLDRIGPMTLVLTLALCAAACYAPALRARARGAARSAVADYLLLLGALLVSADLGYAEAQFHLLGANWSRQLLILTGFHACTAYALGSPLVLSVALTSMAGWFGIERGSVNLISWQLDSPELGLRAMLCAAVVLAWGAIDSRCNAARFRGVFDHFAVNLGSWGALAWCWDPHWRPAGVAALLALAAISVRRALRGGPEAFAVYGVGYAAAGICLVIARATDFGVMGATLVLAVALTATALLRYLHGLARAPRP